MIKAVRGTRDFLPEEAERLRFIEETALRIFGRYGYREIRTPLFEKTELFSRAVGGTTDIVEKEMYTFPDRNGESLALRPEGTAAVVRAFLENGQTRNLPWRVCYRGPMFRYERPQKGRYRQFHQIGCELFGPEGPLADAEMMAMIMAFLEAIGLRGRLELEINSLGCPVCREPYRERLVRHLTGVRDGLCDNCRQRLDRNPLRVLDCKEPGCRELAAAAPHLSGQLCPACRDHFGGLTAHLDVLGLRWRHNPLMVRGLDYYSRTAFEVTTGDLGAQNAVAAGGRYDALVAEMGGPPTPAIGFAAGLERLALLLEDGVGAAGPPDAYLVAVEQGVGPALVLAESLRAAGRTVDLNLQGGSMKSQMKKADRSGAPVTLILAGQEALDATVTVKDMHNGQQRVLPRDGLLDQLWPTTATRPSEP
ncbi:MAG: histidine--tRNA ligase [Magnetococcales bacterium]|nr:histidine--tRNA ligase [Magnetococcales bacterium]